MARLRSMRAARLRAVPHFANAPKTFIARLAQALKPCTFGPNDVVLEDGQENAKLYCIAKGRVQVENCWTEYVEVTAILHEGSTLSSSLALPHLHLVK